LDDIGLRNTRIDGLAGRIGGAQEYKLGLFFAGGFAGFIFFLVFAKNQSGILSGFQVFVRIH
jgi:hypothetical protein